ncbi:MAG: transporter [Phycisphaerales bacterium]|nr:transporter [Phycisphaerales bacterium]MCI0630996.1 transporter [Phycisphaerales bacterium]MCI0676760.1 transporter [Phycisphaerales bacterium]
MFRARPFIVVIAITPFGVNEIATAQTPINAPGAMQPSTGTGVYHIMPMYREIGSDPTSNVLGGREYIVLSQIAYGVSQNFSLQIDVPVGYRDLQISGPGSADDHEAGIGDTTLLAKLRVYRDDPAPTDTTRLSLAGGLQIPGNVDFEMDSSNDAWDPIIGAIFSTVRGRHGFNVSAFWEFYTGNDDDQSDSLRADASYLFRLLPEAYTADSGGALYAVAELNGFYGTNGDTEVYLSPGVMFEARTFTLDATVMLPVWQEVEHRAESEYLIGVGLRLSF